MLLESLQKSRLSILDYMIRGMNVSSVAVDKDHLPKERMRWSSRRWEAALLAAPI